MKLKGHFTDATDPHARSNGDDSGEGEVRSEVKSHIDYRMHGCSADGAWNTNTWRSKTQAHWKMGNQKRREELRFYDCVWLRWRSFLTAPKGMLHDITKPLLWEIGAQVWEDVFEHSQSQTRVEINRKEWKSHWQVGTPEQLLEKSRGRMKPCKMTCKMRRKHSRQ